MGTALVSRRTLLRGSAATAGVLIIGGLGWTVGKEALFPAPATGLLVLSEREIRTILAVGEVIFPEGPFPISAADADIVAQVDDILGDSLAPTATDLFRTLLKLLEWGTYVSTGARFSDLSVEERHEVLEIWGRPGVMLRRVMFDALKMVMSMAYFRNQTVRDHMGYRVICGGGEQ